MSLTMEVTGMQCSKCADRAKDAIRSIVGTECADVDLDSKLVSVNHADTDEGQIKRAIEDLGFDVRIVAD